MKFYVSIDKKDFDKLLKEAAKEWVKCMGDEDEGYIFEGDTGDHELEYDKDTDLISIRGKVPFGYINLEAEPHEFFIVAMISKGVKLLNKLKSAFESLK